MTYEFNVTLTGDFEQNVERVKAALMEEQLGIVSEVNVQAVFKTKMDKDIPPYRIYGACNPKLAAELIAVEPNAGTLLPCNFIMYMNEQGDTVVSFMDPLAVLGLAQSEIAQSIAQQANDKLQRVYIKLRH